MLSIILQIIQKIGIMPKNMNNVIVENAEELLSHNKEYEKILYEIKEKSPGIEKSNFGGGWHSDTSYLEKPALGSMLYALETPTAGGDTMFANMYLAYEALSKGMRRMLDRLIGVNSSAQGYRGGRAKKMQELDGMKDKYIENSQVSVAEHPVVRTHPETGRKGLYASRGHTENFRGMTPAESKPLIDFLADHAVRPEFTCRMRWEPGTLIFWDNRCTQHFAINDYAGERRRMHRVTLVGDHPA